jgi:hypothetical protein
MILPPSKRKYEVFKIGKTKNITLEQAPAYRFYAPPHAPQHVIDGKVRGVSHSTNKFLSLKIVRR